MQPMFEKIKQKLSRQAPSIDTGEMIEEEFTFEELKDMGQGSQYTKTQLALLVLCIILLATGSFGLGRFSVLTKQKTPIRIETLKQEAAVATGVGEKHAVVPPTSTPSPVVKTPAPSAPTTSGMYVASKNGTKYFLPWCGSAQNIKEENKIWFASKADAEKAGYSAAANCKGI